MSAKTTLQDLELALVRATNARVYYADALVERLIRVTAAYIEDNKKELG